MMKKILLTAIIFFFAVSCAGRGQTDMSVQAADEATKKTTLKTINKDLETRHAKSAVQAFATALKTELKSAIAKGGPINAITVCNTRAIAITQDVSAQQGFALSRVSLRNRNTGNTPNDWQKVVLEDFEREKLTGKPAAGLSFAEVAWTDSGRQFRFMKAIPTGPVCLVCHGTDLTSEVKNRLDQLYPNDKARGFREGDIRGAFVVTRDFPD